MLCPRGDLYPMTTPDPGPVLFDIPLRLHSNHSCLESVCKVRKPSSAEMIFISFHVLSAGPKRKLTTLTPPPHAPPFMLFHHSLTAGSETCSQQASSTVQQYNAFHQTSHALHTQAIGNTEKKKGETKTRKKTLFVKAVHCMHRPMDLCRLVKL